MAKKLRDIANDTGRDVLDPIDKFKKTHNYTYLHSLGLGFWIFMVLTFSLGMLFLFYIEEFVSAVVGGYGLIGIFFITILLEMLVQPVGPDLPLVLGTLAGLNGGVVLAVVLLGAYIALYLSYIIGKKIGAPGIERIIGKKQSEMINDSKGKKWFMLIGATTPVPYIPYLAGLWNFSFKDTLLYVVIPRTIRFAIVLLLAHYFGVELLKITLIS